MPTILRNDPTETLQGGTFKICRQSLIEELGEPLDVDFNTLELEKGDAKLREWIDKDCNLNQWGYDEIRHNFVQAFSYHTAREENDIDGEIGFNLYCKKGFKDALWERDSYVLRGLKLYFIADGSLADTDFFQWRIGWRLTLIGDGERMAPDGIAFCDWIDKINEILSPGYSGSCLHLLERLYHKNSRPRWSEKRDCYVGRIKLGDPSDSRFNLKQNLASAVVEIRPTLC